MRFISFLFFPMFALSSCAQGTAGLTIPAGQTFVLGEYRTEGYRATLRNTGSQTITAVVLDQQSGEAVTTVALSGGDRQSVTVANGQEVHLINQSGRPAMVRVKSPVTGRQGMRYVGPDGNGTPDDNDKSPRVALSRSAPSTSPAPAAAPTKNPETIAEVTTVTRMIAPGEALVIGEGTNSGYAAKIRNSGAQIKVAGRNKTSGKQTQGFGLPGTGRETLNVRNTEDLYLINTSGKATKVTVRMDRPVRGARVVKM